MISIMQEGEDSDTQKAPEEKIAQLEREVRDLTYRLGHEEGRLEALEETREDLMGELRGLGEVLELVREELVEIRELLERRRISSS
jgi:flagellar biosynthesis/type III secretory pathway protein FliH